MGISAGLSACWGRSLQRPIFTPHPVAPAFEPGSFLYAAASFPDRPRTSVAPSAGDVSISTVTSTSIVT